MQDTPRIKEAPTSFADLPLELQQQICFYYFDESFKVGLKVLKKLSRTYQPSREMPSLLSVSAEIRNIALLPMIKASRIELYELSRGLRWFQEYVDDHGLDFTFGKHIRVANLTYYRLSVGANLKATASAIRKCSRLEELKFVLHKPPRSIQDSQAPHTWLQAQHPLVSSLAKIKSLKTIEIVRVPDNTLPSESLGNGDWPMSEWDWAASVQKVLKTARRRFRDKGREDIEISLRVGEETESCG